jgi:hypothetical protein
VTDGYILTDKDSGKANVGQVVNIDIGPVFIDLTADLTKVLFVNTDLLELSYEAGFKKTFGIFTPGLKLTGDHALALQTGVWTGDWFSDLTPTLDIAYKGLTVNLYSDMSFEKAHDLLQTVDASACYAWKIFKVRAGLLYANAQAVTDDVGYPNAPIIQEGVSFYARASITY